MGKSDTGRDTLVEHAGALALRSGPWKYIEPKRGPAINRNTNTELGPDPQGQLYNLDTNPGETRNLREEHPDKFAELAAELEHIRRQGRSRP